MNPLGILFIALGLLSLAGGVFNWEWFMNSRKVRLISMILTRTGARIVYMLVGVFVITIGVLATLGMIDMSS